MAAVLNAFDGGPPPPQPPMPVYGGPVAPPPGPGVVPLPQPQPQKPHKKHEQPAPPVRPNAPVYGGPPPLAAATLELTSDAHRVRIRPGVMKPIIQPIRTAYAVWELTLQCNLGCVHCGSRAAKARAEELSTAEAMDLARQLGEVGITEVTLIGGEAFLRPDWLTVVRAIREAGMHCTITTGGYGISESTAERMREAGVEQVSVSIDGAREMHDWLRGRPGSWDACFRSLRNLRQAGIPISCNSQINRLSAPDLPLIYQDIVEAGCRAWQLAITVPMGRAADRPEILLQPSELLDVFPMLNELAGWALRDGLLFYPGNNVGYYGPYERRLRGFGGGGAIWQGCQAGMNTLGIEADGAIKGCPSLPTSAYVGGNIRQKPLARDSFKHRTHFQHAPGNAGRSRALVGILPHLRNTPSCAAADVPGRRMSSSENGGTIRIAIIARWRSRETACGSGWSSRRRRPGEPFDHGEFANCDGSCGRSVARWRHASFLRRTHSMVASRARAKIPIPYPAISRRAKNCEAVSSVARGPWPGALLVSAGRSGSPRQKQSPPVRRAHRMKLSWYLVALPGIEPGF